MQYKPTRSTPEQKKSAKIALLSSLAGTVLGIFFMFNALDPTAAIIGTLVLIGADTFFFLGYMHTSKHGDIWRINLRSNIEAKYAIELPKLPDENIDGEQPINFKADGIDYKMSFYQDAKTFEPFIVPGNYPVTADPKRFER